MTDNQTNLFLCAGHSKQCPSRTREIKIAKCKQHSNASKQEREQSEKENA